MLLTFSLMAKEADNYLQLKRLHVPVSLPAEQPAGFKRMEIVEASDDESEEPVCDCDTEWTTDSCNDMDVD